MPIREALHRLEVGGLVTMTPHRGAIVNEVSEDEIIEIYHIRAVLDGLATRLATPHLTQDDHERLRTIVGAMGAAVKAKDLERVLRINRGFHQIVWRAARADRPHRDASGALDGRGAGDRRRAGRAAGSGAPGGRRCPGEL
jgi:DNA-binding GntR family transcriptional regulator